MAANFFSQCLKMLRSIPDSSFETQESYEFETEDDSTYETAYIGSFMSLDPCGRYHHALSPNGLSNKCVNYWEELDRAASKLGGWIETGEGDPTDIFYCRPARN